MDPSQLKHGIVIHGSILPEPARVLVADRIGTSLKVQCAGCKTDKLYTRILNLDQIEQLTASPEVAEYDGDASHFRFGIEAARLGIAYEYDPYFSLSIARVDPLPHQLEAVYDYFLKLPRIRFLLADDPGAGKTIMAGLLLKELKIRGLVTRTLIVAPANLTFQWQRELKDKFREEFAVMSGEVLRTQYGRNPWQEQNQVITSVSWISRVQDAKESLLQSKWDLIIVDEAHKMSAARTDKRTLPFEIGQKLSERTDRLLLMTATPHKGDPEHFRLFLSLLDSDVYANVMSLETAMREKQAPFYLRRTKEALVTFPDPETGVVKKLFTNREARTAKFELDSEEFRFYESLTRYVEQLSTEAAKSDSPHASVVCFQMAMLQRRFASSVYAVRRSLERMRDKRRKILEDPSGHRQQQIERKLPDDYDDLPDGERDAAWELAESVVMAVDTGALRRDIKNLDRLIE
ncbi:MAG: DEAD/DEAH box helicase [Polyangiaceae bacterium]|nr:DEAD/DEAH box helicase [Polyangiaceae bacterium]